MIKRIALALVALVGSAGPAFAVEVDVAVLLVDPAPLNGSEVTVEGELIGDFMLRDEWVWVQLNGDPYASEPLGGGGELAGPNLGIALRFPIAVFDAAAFETPGGYGVRGPVVRVTGEWRYHDEERGGESYLAVTSVEVLERERRFDAPLPVGVLLTGLGLIAVSGLVQAASRRRSAPDAT